MAETLLSTGRRFSSLPEKYIRPESERPCLSEVISTQVPQIDLGSPNRGEIIRQISEACTSFGFFQTMDRTQQVDAAASSSTQHAPKVQDFKMKNPLTTPGFYNAEDDGEHRPQIGGTNDNALYPSATSNQTQLVAEAGPSAQLYKRVSAKQSMDSRVENGNKPHTQIEMKNINPPILPTMGQTQQVDAASPSTQRAEDNEQRLTKPSMAEGNEILKKWGKITSWAAALSGTTLITVIAAVLQSKNTIPHHTLLASMLISMFVSFTCGVLVLILWALCHGSPMGLAVFKILMLGCIVWAAIGFIIGFAFGIKEMF